MTIISGKNGLKAELSKDSSGFTASVEVTVDANTAILIRSLRKSETPVSNGAKPSDIPAIGEKLALLGIAGDVDQKKAEEFAKKLMENIADPNHFPEYIEAALKKAKKAKKKSKKAKAHFDKTTVGGVQNAGNQAAHIGKTAPAPIVHKGPGGARGA
jgi:hypothetical protein